MANLSDVEIKGMMKAGELIIDGEITCVGPSCYEIRMGDVYYDLTEGGERVDASIYGNILIKPGHLVVLITKEKVDIPNNIIARITSKGSFFSVGLSPVSTYADPGFCGNIGIVTQNITDKFIRIPLGESIAKIDFAMLSRPCEKPYQGQHGFQTQIWPIKYHLQKTYEEVKDDPRVSSEKEEAYRILPRATSSVLKMIQRKQRTIDISIIGLLVVNALLLAGIYSKHVDIIFAIIVNLISSAIVGAFVWFNNNKE
ncbi:MAG: dCTP deaminase domain-containing protein [Desulfuromonadaceae bacterium]